jgi:hypothetical protein
MWRHSSLRAISAHPQRPSIEGHPPLLDRPAEAGKIAAEAIICPVPRFGG